jgi:VWFA-related protein
MCLLRRGTSRELPPIVKTIEAAQIADTRILTMRYNRSSRPRPNGSRMPADRVARDEYGISVMERLARETGGSDFNAAQGNIRGIFRQIAKELRALYEVAYVSTSAVRDGSFRKIAIRTRRARLSVRARTGYFRPVGSLRGIEAPVRSAPPGVTRRHPVERQPREAHWTVGTAIGWRHSTS